MVDSTNLPEVDINQIATDLNGKMDRDGVNATASVCVESWHDNNGNWYRVYSDGWCEQGGKAAGTAGTFVQVNLFKSYNNTAYNILLTAAQTAGTATYSENRYASVNTTYTQTASFKYLISSATGNSGVPVFWRTCGYIN